MEEEMPVEKVVKFVVNSDDGSFSWQIFVNGWPYAHSIRFDNLNECRLDGIKELHRPEVGFTRG